MYGSLHSWPRRVAVTPKAAMAARRSRMGSGSTGEIIETKILAIMMKCSRATASTQSRRDLSRNLGAEDKREEEDDDDDDEDDMLVG